MNLFTTVLTYAAPSSNYRGESAENRAVIQKITIGRFDYAIISPEAIRNALRETLAIMDLPSNRTRLHDQEQLAVKFEDYPDPDKYIDDFFMGWLIAATGPDRKKHLENLQKNGRPPEKFSFKRDSVLRLNMALALEPYRYDSVFTQSPLNVDSPWRNADNSQLLHRETVHTAFQYPFALNLNDCGGKAKWTQALLKAVGQLNGVAGNHARSYFEFSPASLVVRLTPQLVAGYNAYGFGIDENGNHTSTEVIEGILKDDYPGQEFFLAGKLVKDLDDDTHRRLKEKGVTLDRSPQRLLEQVGKSAFPA
ncbi:MAG: type I-B CRISPR-associated protein Cas7/Cst2/DevR [Proteobacteria bacterium]|nr:type I-B CRISPR-associated protein Cas7/Cst2/DevR [Pseudomonadota bacterium]